MMLSYQNITIKANPTILSRRGQKHNLTKLKVISPPKNLYYDNLD
jgi:hypothetical protein